MSGAVKRVLTFNYLTFADTLIFKYVYVSVIKTNNFRDKLSGTSANKASMVGSGSFLAEISVSSPRKLFIFII